MNHDYRVYSPPELALLEKAPYHWEVWRGLPLGCSYIGLNKVKIGEEEFKQGARYEYPDFIIILTEGAVRTLRRYQRALFCVTVTHKGDRKEARCMPTRKRSLSELIATAEESNQAIISGLQIR